MTYTGSRFENNFSDFINKYGFTDLYTAGFYPFPTLEELWAFWSRQIYINRYQPIPGNIYETLRILLKNRNYFILTTNVDHCFQRTGFDKNRLFYTQGDFGLWQCSLPCHPETYDNRDTVLKMIAEQRDMHVPENLVPHCPRCGRPMSMNLRIDSTFVENAGWHQAKNRYLNFLDKHKEGKIGYLELGVGENTPVIIKYPFWKMTSSNPQAFYVPINLKAPYYPEAIREKTLGLTGDLRVILEDLLP